MFRFSFVRCVVVGGVNPFAPHVVYLSFPGVGGKVAFALFVVGGIVAFALLVAYLSCPFVVGVLVLFAVDIRGIVVVGVRSAGFDYQIFGLDRRGVC